VIGTVTVGNPGNPGEQSRLPNSDPTFYGGVAYAFSIGKYELTAGRYVEFLNAGAATDTHNLYNTRMDYDANPSDKGCNIKRQGASGSYTYSVAPDWANRPVNFVSWADAVRFANWLHNGQPTGAQDLTTTEDGSYFINGIHEFSDRLLEDVVREPDATWVIPTDNEWYKAAYHKNDGVTGNYWNYGTSFDLRPDNDLIDPDPGNQHRARPSACRKRVRLSRLPPERLPRQVNCRSRHRHRSCVCAHPRAVVRVVSCVPSDSTCPRGCRPS
jgi:sulfatase modifying factor 1